MHVAYEKPVNKGQVARTKEAFLEFHNPFYRGVRSKQYTYAVGVDGEWLLWDNIDFESVFTHDKIITVEKNL